MMSRQSNVNDYIAYKLLQRRFILYKYQQSFVYIIEPAKHDKVEALIPSEGWLASV